MQIVGWGGAATPFNTFFEPKEEETLSALKNLTKSLRDVWILVTHAPPKGTSLDLVGKNKHVGSDSVRKIIRAKKPLLAISAHIHENGGKGRVGRSTIFYPGPAYSGFYGMGNLNDNGVECLIKRATP